MFKKMIFFLLLFPGLPVYAFTVEQNAYLMRLFAAYPRDSQYGSLLLTSFEEIVECIAADRDDCPGLKLYSVYRELTEDKGIAIEAIINHYKSIQPAKTA